MTKTDFISVIVATYNAENTIKKCIDSLLDLEFENYEIIVVDDASTDGSETVLQPYIDSGKIQVVYNPENVGPSIGRNRGVAAAKGNYIAFTDSDCIVHEDWLKELMAGFEKYPEAAQVGGTQLVPDDECDFGKAVARAFSKMGFATDYIKEGAEITQTRHNPTCNAMFRRDVLEEMNGFRENLWPGEDVELDHRIVAKGYDIYFNPRAIVYHYRPSNINQLRKMMFRYGYVQAELVKLYGFSRGIQYIPVIALIGFLVSVMVLFALPSLIFVYLLVFILSALLCFAADIGATSTSIPVLVVNSLLCWNLGYFRRFMGKD